MRFYKLRLVQNASLLAANYNGMVEGEDAPMTDFERRSDDEELVVGEKVRKHDLDSFCSVESR